MTKIDEAQMSADFAAIPVRVDGPMRRAREIVEAHIADYGMVPHPDKIKEAIAAELGFAEIRGADRLVAAQRAHEPDWPPHMSAVGLRDGTLAKGSTGQTFEVRNGQWCRTFL